MTSAIENERQILNDKAASLHLPKNFILGAATAAYQIEGAPTAGGKSESSPPAVQFLHVRGHRTARNQPAQRGNQQEGCCSRLGSPLRDAS